MAILKMKKIKEMGEKELNDNLNELRLELSKDRGASEIGTVKSPGKIRAVRKSIARIKTVINQKSQKKGGKGIFDGNIFDSKVFDTKKIKGDVK
ncbi:MAG: 50S ribosomal protein L29 [Candidatus Aenigmarchaeota archaeon]|nr:50S ribosomal protein L29 [Candidatus Aenigmarchaeota archaeon]